MLAEIDGAAADIDVGVADRADHLGQGDVVGVELVEVDLDLEFLGGAAPGVDLDDALDGQETALHDPILDGAKIGQPEMRRPHHLVAIDFADQARSLDLRHDVVRQADVLLQVDRGLREREIIIDPVFEGHADEGEAIERGRADDIDPWRRGQANLHRDRVIALHLFGGQAGGLGGDLQDHGRRIGVGFDVQLAKRDETAADENQQAQ